MKAFLFLFLITFHFTGIGQSAIESRGVIIDSLPVKGAIGETFAAYLPSNHPETATTSIVFIFDPAGRGNTGIRPFIEVAEKYNYILICSNNSRNGPYAPNLEIADRLFKTVFATYTIDPDRIYTAGFSGGSRLAATIAVLSGSIQGVIACGAGFAQYPLYFPEKKSNFSYVAIVGNKDMNYREMNKTRSWMESLEISNELFIFEGEHQWPPPSAMMRAFNWLEEESFRKGLKPLKPSLRNENFKEIKELSEELLSEGELVDAARELERMIRSYPDMIPSDSLEKQLKKIKRDKRYRKERAILKKVAVVEDTLNHEMKERFAYEVSLGASPDQFKWWEVMIDKLNKKYSVNEAQEYRLMAYRLKRQLFAMVGESMDSFLREKKEKEQEYAEQLLLIIAPDSPFTHYQLARKYAVWKNYTSALKHLEKVLQLGWTDKDFLLNTREFNEMKKMDAFNELLNSY